MCLLIKKGENVRKLLRDITTFVYETRAGAHAGLSLSFDPKGKKNVLMRPSSFELKKILKMLITSD